MSSDDAKDQPVGLPPGTRIGKYEIRERLGIGGQAIIYKAYDSLLDRLVAIKQISTHLAADAKFMERFRREAQILAKLGSEQPAIVTIHDLVQDERGLFIVMEYVAGYTLEQSLADNSGPVDPKAVLALLWRLAAGLHAVHAAGIIHRDIKPANIIIGEKLKAKIMDFGVAASLSGQTSMVLGTTKYMAPELYGGQNVDARVDMYSLGFIAYEMLVGRAKFNQIFAEVVRDPHSEALRWMKWHGNEQVQAPALHEVNPTIAPALSEIVAKMIAKDPQKRFASMEEFGRTLKTTFSPRNGAKDEAEPQIEAPKSAAAPAEPLPTAALPKQKLSLKTKLFIAGGVSVVLMGLLISVIVISRSGQQRLSDQLKSRLLDAQKLMSAAKDEDAIPTLEKLTKFRGDEGAMANVLLHLAKARVMLNQAQAPPFERSREDDWRQIGQEAELARQKNNDLQAAGAQFADFVRQTNTDMATFDGTFSTARAFCSTMQTSLKALNGQKYDDADRALTEGMRGISLAEAQKGQLTDMRQKIGKARFSGAFGAATSAAKAAMEKEDWLAADKSLKAARTLYDSSDDRKFFDLATQTDLRDQLKKLQDQYDVSSKYAQAMATARRAKQENKLDDVLAAYLEANRLKPSPELKAQINSISAEIAFNKGKDALKSNQISTAQRYFREALQHDPKHQGAADELKKIDDGRKFDALMKEGDNAYDAKDYATALAKYTGAAALRSDDDLKERIKACQYYIKYDQAKKFQVQRNYDKAMLLLDECRKLLPDKGPEIDVLVDQINKSRDYDQFVARGKALLDNKDGRGARVEFEKAKDKNNTPEIVQLIEKALYTENLVQGQTAMQQKLYKEASWYFRQARDHGDTPEIRDLIKKADDAQGAPAPAK